MSPWPRSRFEDGEGAMFIERVPQGKLDEGRAVRGFTLVELMVALAVIAVLTAVALPSYSSYVMRSKRADAKTVILQAAQFMERNYTLAGRYDLTVNGVAVALPLTLTQAPTTGVANYTITLVLQQQAFALTAAPCGASSSTCSGFTDPDCGSLTLDNAGTKGTVPILAPTATLQCWQR